MTLYNSRGIVKMEIQNLMEQELMALKERAAGQSQKLIYMDSKVCPVCKGTGFEYYEDEQGVHLLGSVLAVLGRSRLRKIELSLPTYLMGLRQ